MADSETWPGNTVVREVYLSNAEIIVETTFLRLYVKKFD